MKTVCGLLVYVLLLGRIGLAAPTQHVVGLGKWTTVKLMVGEDERTALDLKGSCAPGRRPSQRIHHWAAA